MMFEKEKKEIQEIRQGLGLFDLDLTSEETILLAGIGIDISERPLSSKDRRRIASQFFLYHIKLIRRIKQGDDRAKEAMEIFENRRVDLSRKLSLPRYDFGDFRDDALRYKAEHGGNLDDTK